MFPWDPGSSLLSLFWFIFLESCLFPLYLVVFWGFYLSFFQDIFFFFSWLTFYDVIFALASVGLWFWLLLFSLWWGSIKSFCSFLMAGNENGKNWVLKLTLLSKGLIQLSAGGCLIVVWPDCSMVGFMATFKRVHAKGDFPSFLLPVPCAQCPHCGESLLTYASTGVLQTQVGSFASVSYGITAPFLWVFVPVNFCLCPPWLESLFTPALQKSYNQILLPFNVRFPGDSQSLGSLAWGSEPWQQWENVFGILFSSLWVTDLEGMGSDFTVTVALLLFHCNFFVSGRGLPCFGGF